MDRYYNLPRILRELRETVLFERGFLFTAWQVFKCPGSAIRQILESGPHRFQDPIKFLFLCVALAVLAMNLEFTQKAMFGNVQFPELAAGERFEAVEQQLQEIIDDPSTKRELRFRVERAQRELKLSAPEWAIQKSMQWMNVALLLVVPLYAIGTWLIFRRSLNFAEHLAFNGYIYGVQCLLSILTIPVYFWSMNAGTIIYFIISTLYQFFAWRDILQISGWFEWLKCILMLVAVFATYMVLLILGTIVVIVSMLLLQMT
ncbi:MAG: hypothetical protein JNL67_05525 [Planctomycetaceae bacterium]|nr:hypothetical protein [Planctomycetaceae bacterium]